MIICQLKFINNNVKPFNKFFKDTNESIAYDEEELTKGIKVEKEHTENEDLAKTIAKHHLEEDPKYYTKLLKLGL